MTLSRLRFMDRSQADDDATCTPASLDRAMLRSSPHDAPSSAASEEAGPLVSVDAAMSSYPSGDFGLAPPNERDTELGTLLNEVRVVFGRLFLEVSRSSPRPPEAPGGDDEQQVPLLADMLRSQLIERLVSCQEAIIAELAPVEAGLWDAFISMDTSLAGSLDLRDGRMLGCLGEALGELADCEREACLAELTERSIDGELDFVDLLDIFARSIAKGCSVQVSLRHGYLQFLQSGPSRMEPRRLAEVRSRAASISLAQLTQANAAYQRTLVLTCSWQCEKHLGQLIAGEEVACFVFNDRRETLLTILRAIREQLSPTECVLWEVLGTTDANFDGSFAREEVEVAVRDLLASGGADGAVEDAAAAAAAEASGGQEALLELRKMRAECRLQFVEDLFPPATQEVTLADVLRLWWDMPEDYREAAGFSVPSALLRRSARVGPEEMFEAQLRRCATDQTFARQALQGHARAFAHLRSLIARRSVESLRSQSPTETRSQSDVSGCDAATGGLTPQGGGAPPRAVAAAIAELAREDDARERHRDSRVAYNAGASNGRRLMR